MTLHRVGVVNVPTKVGRANWLRCWLVIANRTSVFAVNETLTRRQKRTYLAAARLRRWGQYGTRNSPNPIYYSRAKWRFVEGAVVPLHGPGPWARQWPGYNAGRSATVAVLDWRKNNQRHAVIATHWVSDGYKNPRPWRDQVRGESLTLIRELVAASVAKGYVTWLIGDTNIRAPFPVPGMTWVRGDGIDKIGVALPTGMTLGRNTWRLVAAPTDHQHGVVGRVTITKEKAA